MTTREELHVILGTGPLGQWTMRELLLMDKKVRMVNRSGYLRELPEGVEVMAGDVRDVSEVIRLTKGAAAVYQCAQPAYHDWVESFVPMQQSIVAGAAANGARLIVAENLYMYGMPTDMPFIETTANRAHTRKGKVRQLMTEALELAHTEGKLQVARVRGSDFWGPEDYAGTPFIFGPILAGKRATILGDRHRLHTFTYVPDFGRALAIAGTRDQSFGEIWHVPSNPPVTQLELCQLIAAQLGTPVATRLAETWLIRLLGVWSPLMREMVEMMYQWKQSFVMDSSKFQQAFRMLPTPIDTAIANTLSWYRDSRSQF